MKSRARTWIANFRASLPTGSVIPSERAIISAAAKSEDGKDIPRRAIAAARIAEWKLEGAPIE